MALTLALFGVLNDGEIILLAKLVRDTAHLCPRTVFFLALIMLGFKGSARNKIRAIYNDMCVDMVVVGMYRNDILILFFQQSVT